MTRETIDIGIDLGTTNSAIGRFAGREVHIVKNNLNSEITPSAVWVNGGGAVLVGSKARERAVGDADNVAIEFKQQMGLTGVDTTFRASGRTMTPPELSAQVLLSLGRDLRRRADMDLDAAVITVPAAFELHQCEATRKAAELAGLTVSPLLQEPTAAAFAYSYGHAVDKAFWLVFDLGGGTFDASVITVREGEFTVVTHVGDNQLGGKRIDWDIVETLLAPAVVAERKLPDFVRGNPRWSSNITKLKMAAEQLKIELSDEDCATVDLEHLDDGSGNLFDVQLQVDRAQVEAIAGPYYRRAINYCRRALTEAQLPAGAVDRVILVGGATLAPGLRAMLADPGDGLGIRLDHSLDPVTVVARGAAIFAATQRLPRSSAPPPPGRFELRTEHALIGVDLDPLVGGRIVGAGNQDWTGWGVELVNDDAPDVPYRSGRVPLAGGGAFAHRVHVEPRSRTEFRVELFDAQGRAQEMTPDRLVYTHNDGPVPGEAVLTHGVGVALANREMLWMLDKGSPIPAKRDVVLETVIDVRRTANQGLIRVPIMEGEQPRADRNRQVGVMEITPQQIRRDVPAGTEVEVTLSMSASRELSASAFVPLLDEEYDITIDMSRTLPPDPAVLRGGADELEERLDDLRRRVAEADAAQARQNLATLEEEETVAQIRRQLAASERDADAAADCEARMIAANIELDKVEDALELPTLLHDLDQVLALLRERVDGHRGGELRREVRGLEDAAQSARRTGDTATLRRLISSARDLARTMLNETGELPVIHFHQLADRCAEVGMTREMQGLVAEGERAIQAGDVATLRSVNFRLGKLLPRDAVPVLGSGTSTVDLRSGRGR